MVLLKEMNLNTLTQPTKTVRAAASWKRKSSSFFPINPFYDLLLTWNVFDHVSKNEKSANKSGSARSPLSNVDTVRKLYTLNDRVAMEI